MTHRHRKERERGAKELGRNPFITREAIGNPQKTVQSNVRGNVGVGGEKGDRISFECLRTNHSTRVACYGINPAAEITTAFQPFLSSN